MSEQQKETLSALFDGETSEFETRRLLSELDDEQRSQWRNHQIVRDSINKSLDASVMSINIADAVAAEIANDPAPVIEAPAQATAANDQNINKQQSWLKPAVGFAAAASVAFIAVIGVQQQDSGINGANTSFVANGNVSASQLKINSKLGLEQGLSPVSGVSNASINSDTQSSQLSTKDQQELLQYYMQKHVQHASFNNSRGLMPMARMTDEEK